MRRALSRGAGCAAQLIPGLCAVLFVVAAVAVMLLFAEPSRDADPVPERCGVRDRRGARG